MSTTAVCSADQYNKDSVFVSEYDLKQRPKKTDIAETRRLFRDFCINIPIPEFESLVMLYRWRRDVISGDYAEVEPAYEIQKQKGKQRKVSIEDFEPYYERYINKQATRQQLIEELKISMSTFHLLVSELVKGAR